MGCVWGSEGLDAPANKLLLLGKHPHRVSLAGSFQQMLEITVALPAPKLPFVSEGVRGEGMSET